jgi:hypothetical protein
MSVFGATNVSDLIDTTTLTNPFDGQNNLYARIFDELNAQYQHIGKRQADNILLNNNLAITGGLNTIGLNYNRPFGDFSISLARNLAPDITDDKRWIVTDTFAINIDASKLISNLTAKKVINLDEKNMAAFVGIVFKRTFTWVHFANSYEEGLSTQFEKLFFPFNALKFGTLATLANNEMIFKEDSISVDAGGFVSAPIYPGIAAMGGVLAKFQKLSRFEAIAMDGNNLQITLEKSKLESLGISTTVQATFLKLIKLTLMSYDFEYEHQESYTIYTNFKSNDLLNMSEDNPVGVEINQIIKNKEANLAILAPYIISEEKKVSNLISQKYNFLIFGGQKSSSTQEIEITNHGKVKTFFTHQYEKVKFTEDFFSEIFAGIISALTNSDVATTTIASDTKKVGIEYDSVQNLIASHESIELGDLSNTQKLSLNFSGEFMTKKTDGVMGKKYRDRAMFALENYSGVDPLITQMLERNYLQAPIHINGNYQVNTDGIRYLNGLPVSQVFDYIAGLCDDKPRSGFFNFRNLFDNCRVSLENDYVNYIKDLRHNKVTSNMILQCTMLSTQFKASSGKRRTFIKNCLHEASANPISTWTNIPLWTLKNFSQSVVNNSNSKVHFYNLFGVSNVFFYGSVDAVTADGRPFVSAFHEGQFKGFGAVDHYMRLENLREPASVVVGQ